MSLGFRKSDKEADLENIFSSRSIYARVGIEFLRHALSYFSFVFISSVLFFAFVYTYVNITAAFDRIPRLMYVVSSLSILFTMYSVFRSIELYDREAQIAFLSIEGRYSFAADLKAIYKNPTLRLKMLMRLGVFICFICIFPYEFGYRQLVGAFYPEFDMSAQTASLIVKLIMCPVAVILAHFATVSAHKWWLLGTEASREKILTCRNYNMRVILEQVKIFAVYGVGFYFLPSVLLMLMGFVSTLRLFRDATILLWVAGVILFTVIIFYLIAFSRRKKFLKRLYKLAGEEDWEISKVRHPYISLFRAYRGYDFTLKKEGKVFTCKLIGSVKRNSPTYIDYQGKITAKVTFSILRLELFHLLIDTDYTFDGEGEKIVILAPEPKRIFINQGRTDIAPDSQDERSVMGGNALSRLLRKSVTKTFQTGDRVGKYKFFTADGFISAMDNNCLHR